MVPEYATYLVYVRHEEMWRPEPAKATALQLGALKPEDLQVN
jgi:hypothetical protein